MLQINTKQNLLKNTIDRGMIQVDKTHVLPYKSMV